MRFQACIFMFMRQSALSGLSAAQGKKMAIQTNA